MQYSTSDLIYSIADNVICKLQTCKDKFVAKFETEAPIAVVLFYVLLAGLAISMALGGIATTIALYPFLYIMSKCNVNQNRATAIGSIAFLVLILPATILVCYVWHKMNNY